MSINALATKSATVGDTQAVITDQPIGKTNCLEDRRRERHGTCVNKPGLTLLCGGDDDDDDDFKVAGLGSRILGLG